MRCVEKFFSHLEDTLNFTGFVASIRLLEDAVTTDHPFPDVRGTSGTDWNVANHLHVVRFQNSASSWEQRAQLPNCLRVAVVLQALVDCWYRWGVEW